MIRFLQNSGKLFLRQIAFRRQHDEDTYIAVAAAASAIVQERQSTLSTLFHRLHSVSSSFMMLLPEGPLSQLKKLTQSKTELDMPPLLFLVTTILIFFIVLPFLKKFYLHITSQAPKETSKTTPKETQVVDTREVAALEKSVKYSKLSSSSLTESLHSIDESEDEFYSDNVENTINQKEENLVSAKENDSTPGLLLHASQGTTSNRVQDDTMKNLVEETLVQDTSFTSSSLLPPPNADLVENPTTDSITAPDSTLSAPSVSFITNTCTALNEVDDKTLRILDDNQSDATLYTKDDDGAGTTVVETPISSPPDSPIETFESLYTLVVNGEKEWIGGSADDDAFGYSIYESKIPRTSSSGALRLMRMLSVNKSIMKRPSIRGLGKRRSSDASTGSVDSV